MAFMDQNKCLSLLWSLSVAFISYGVYKAQESEQVKVSNKHSKKARLSRVTYNKTVITYYWKLNVKKHILYV